MATLAFILFQPVDQLTIQIVLIKFEYLRVSIMASISLLVARVTSHGFQDHGTQTKIAETSRQVKGQMTTELHLLFTYTVIGETRIRKF